MSVGRATPGAPAGAAAPAGASAPAGAAACCGAEPARLEQPVVPHGPVLRGVPGATRPVLYNMPGGHLPRRGRRRAPLLPHVPQELRSGLLPAWP